MKLGNYIYKGYYPQIFNNPNNSDCLMEEFEDSPESAYSFLHGYCSFFALALAKKFKYEIHVLWVKEELTSYFCHAYCSFVYHGDTFFVDIRGITNDFNEMLEEFEITTKDIDKERSFICDEELLEKSDYYTVGFNSEELVNAAMSFISNNPSFYSFDFLNPSF